MVIAKTQLEIVSNETVKRIEIRIMAPEQGDNDWTCRYEIDWPDQKRTMLAHGHDSAQALLLAYYMIGADLYSSSFHANGQLQRDGIKGDFGFPVSSSIRDKVTGYVDY